MLVIEVIEDAIVLIKADETSTNNKGRPFPAPANINMLMGRIVKVKCKQIVTTASDNKSNGKHVVELEIQGPSADAIAIVSIWGSTSNNKARDLLMEMNYKFENGVSGIEVGEQNIMVCLHLRNKNDDKMALNYRNPNTYDAAYIYYDVDGVFHTAS